MAQVQACKRISVAKCPAKIPTKYFEALEHNQKISSCCRHPENHDIEAWYSTQEEANKGTAERPHPPDIYIFTCTCGRQHRRFCVGGNNPITGEKDIRPYWEIR